ncbi:MAG: hypothetical protein PHP02_08155 [Eubacteriales bacterium]|nr:hypothetical protein [Eubacteriales bacterium]
MSTITYKCPSCAAPLTYDGQSQKMKCGNCGNEFDVETVRQVARIEQEDRQHEDMSWTVQDEAFTPEEAAHTRMFSCSSCGAELFTDETTLATNCAFCGSPSVIPAQFTLETKPQEIIPFQIEKAQAEQMFHDYFKNRKLIPNLFLTGRNVIDEIRQLYVPYWLFDCDADARMTYRGTRMFTSRSGNYRITTTQHYLIRRAGTLGFRKLPVDASSRMDNKITESIEPFNTNQSIVFVPETLSGAQANRADVDAESSQERANQRVKSSTLDAFRQTVAGYASVIPQSASINLINATSIPVLYPIWHITTKKGGKTYTFAINGQTGELTCDIPWSKGKFFGRLFGMAGIAAAIGMALVYTLSSVGVIK